MNLFYLILFVPNLFENLLLFMNCREASREEKASRDNLEAIKVDVQQAEQDFRRLVPRVLFDC